MNASIPDGIAVEAPSRPIQVPEDRRTRTLKNVSRGVWLMVTGTLWILWNLWIINWRWMESYGFALIGVLLLVQTIAAGRFRLFLGSWLLLVGGFHVVLSHMDSFRMREVWPMYAVLTGVAFLFHFLANTRRWFSLVACCLLIGYGILSLSVTFLGFPYTVVSVLRHFWPLGLVAAGLILIGLAIWSKRKKL